MTGRERLLSAGMVLMSGLLLFGSGARVCAAQGAGVNDAQIVAEVQKQLDNKKLLNVTSTVHDGDVSLGGTVEVYADKEEAGRLVHHVKKVKGVDNEIKVAGPAVDDSALRSKLAQALAYDRVGYGTTAFNAITINVQQGVITLGGMVYGPEDKDSALSLVAHTPGVKDIVDNLDVAPMSPMDDQLRTALARTIYGTPELQKYALNPALPIRIMVVRGNVTLSGVVDSKMDRDVAGLRANSVPGVFKVVNDIEVAGQQTGK